MTEPNSNTWSWEKVLNNTELTRSETKQERIERCSKELLKLIKNARLEQDVIVKGQNYFNNIQPRTLRAICRGQNVKLGSLLNVLTATECVLHLSHRNIGWLELLRAEDFGRAVWKILTAYNKTIAQFSNDPMHNSGSAFSRQTLSNIVNGDKESLANIEVFTVLTICFELGATLRIRYSDSRKLREIQFLSTM